MFTKNRLSETNIQWKMVDAIAKTKFDGKTKEVLSRYNAIHPELLFGGKYDIFFKKYENDADLNACSNQFHMMEILLNVCKGIFNI